MESTATKPTTGSALMTDKGGSEETEEPVDEHPARDASMRMVGTASSQLGFTNGASRPPSAAKISFLKTEYERRRPRPLVPEDKNCQSGHHSTDAQLQPLSREEKREFAARIGRC